MISVNEVAEEAAGSRWNVFLEERLSLLPGTAWDVKELPADVVA
jgi:hypothetical protein